jgi:NACalpha-BTF3-like transcription factor
MGVEIEQEVMNPNHPNNVKEVQKLSFNTEDVREMHRLTIANPDNGSFRIQFTSPDLKRSISDEMKTNMSGNEIRDRVKGYFSSRGVNTIVKKQQLNAADEETDIAEEIVKLVFEIRLDRLVAAPSTSNMVVAKGSSKSEITLEMNVVASNPPMTGQF